ncbi:NPCBM/NEW2 domain-containing protein, partial [bacterium]|nr:NPCBM/NEW2 domain-containing protein [bacterium]
PLKNISLIPYSGGKYYPLSLKEKDGKIVRVKGFGVIPYLGPKKTPVKEVKEREAKIEFFIWPGSYSYFKAKVGINPLFKESEGKVVFRIFADEKLIFKTSPISSENSSMEIKINLPEKIHFLTLSMLTVKEPSGPLSKTHPHGVWAYTILE